jgi:hypothetical protein
VILGSLARLLNLMPLGERRLSCASAFSFFAVAFALLSGAFGRRA